VTVRTALVTGASSGIGRGIAVALAGAGHRVALTGRNKEQLERTAGLCGPGALTVAADLTTTAAVDQIFAATEAEFGPVEIMIANAGIARSAPLAKTTDAEWDEVIALNLTVPFKCVRRAVPAMKAAGWGRIVVMGSIASRVGAPYIAAYTASKHGVLGLVRAAAAELVTSGVTVNAVCPAYVDTPLTEESIANVVARTGRSAGQAREIFEAQQPIGRLIAVDEVVAAVMFCVDNGAITGQGINVDGGAVQA
jgi:NAD(P)-dependent dehydrogenase (short-subunit alcohol dehydrogenase family)